MVSDYLGQLPTPLHRRSRGNVRLICDTWTRPWTSGGCLLGQNRVPVWFKTFDRLVRADGSEASEAEHRAAIAYASDYLPLEPALRRHGKFWLEPGLKSASLDHAMWFHRSARADEWLLYVLDSPSAQGGRMLAQGSIFNRSGELVATVAQEMMFRLPEYR